jgi:hypothetical protein
MEFLAILFALLALYFYLDKRFLLKRIRGEKEIQAWSTKYSYEMRMNRESLLSPEQIKEMVELDAETKKKFEKEVPGVKGIYG